MVLATGFQASRVLAPMDVRGRSGRSVRELWDDDDASAYLGICVPDLPNLFLLSGPHTVLGHGGSYIAIAEAQVGYVLDLLCQLVDRGLGEVEVRRSVDDAYNARVDAAHRNMVWSHPGVTSWYRNSKGRVVANLPWRIVDYWQLTRHADLADFATTTRRVAVSAASRSEPTSSRATRVHSGQRTPQLPSSPDEESVTIDRDGGTYVVSGLDPAAATAVVDGRRYDW